MAGSVYLLKFGADYKSVTEAIGNINSQMRTLRSESRNLSSTFKLTGDSSVAVRQIENLEKQYDLLRQKQGQYQQVLEKVSKEPGFDASSRSAQKLNSDLSKVTSQMEMVQAQANKLKSNTAFSTLDRDINNAQTRLSALQDAGKRFNTAFKLTGDTKDFTSMMSNMRGQITQSNNLVTALKEKLNQLSSQPGFNSQSQQAQALQAQITRTTADLNLMRENYSRLSESKPFIQIDQQLSQLDEKIKGAESNAKAFSESFKVTGNFSALESQINALKGALTQSESKVDTLKNALRQLENEQGIDKESSRVRELQTTLTRAKTDVVQLRTRINSLASEHGLQGTTAEAGHLAAMLHRAFGLDITSAFRGQLRDTREAMEQTGMTAERTGNRINSGMLRGQRSTSTLRSLLSSITGVLGGVERGANRVRLSFGNIVGMAGGLSLISSGLGYMKESLDGAVSRYDTLQKYPRVMDALGYSTQDTTNSTEILKKSVDGLPTKLQDITAVAQQLAPITGSATRAAQSASALNNAFLASGASAEDSSRGMIQYIQMLSTGKADMMSWRTLMETMPTSLRKVANSFGFTGKSAEQDLYKALQSGQITMDQLNDKFIELDKSQNGFAEMARKNSSGIGTSFANMRTAVTNGLADMLKEIDAGFNKEGLGSVATQMDKTKGVIKKAFSEINPIVGKTTTAIIEFVKNSTVMKNVQGVFRLVGQLVSNLFSALTQPIGKGGKSPIQLALEFIGQVFNQVQSVIKNGISILQDLWNWLTKPVGKGGKSPLETALSTLSGVGKSVFNVVQSLSNGVKNIVDQMTRPIGKGKKSPLSEAFETLKPITSQIVPLFKDAASAVSAVIKFLTTPIGGKKGNDSPLVLAFRAMVFVLQPAINIIGGVLQALKGLMQFITGVFTGNWNKAWQGIKNIFSGAIKAIAQWLSIQFFAGLGGKAVGALKGAFQGLGGWFGNIFRDVVSRIGSHLNPGNLGGIAGRAFNAITSVFGRIGGAMSNIFNAGINAIRNVFNGSSLGNIGRNAWNGLQGAFSKAGQAMSRIGHDIIMGLWNGIANMGNWLADKVHDFALKVVPGPIKKALGIHSPSRLMRDEVGRFIPLGIAGGIDDTANTVETAMANVKTRVMAGISGINPVAGLGDKTKEALSPLQGDIMKSINIDTTQSAVSVTNLSNALLGLMNRMESLRPVAYDTISSLNNLGMISQSVNITITGLNNNMEALREMVGQQTRRVLRQEQLI